MKTILRLAAGFAFCFAVAWLGSVAAMPEIPAWKVDRFAASLLLPYLLWIGYATALNAGIAQLNP